MKPTTDPKSWKIGDVFIYAEDERDSLSAFYILGKVIRTRRRQNSSVSVFYRAYSSSLKLNLDAYDDEDLFDTASSAYTQNNIYNIKDDLKRAFRIIKRKGKLKETLKSIFMRSL